MKTLDEVCGACDMGKIENPDKSRSGWGTPWIKCPKCKGTGHVMTHDGEILWNFIERHLKRLKR